MLDVNLGGITSVEVARRLKQMAVPFVYVSGYGNRGAMEELPKAQLVQKPLRYEELISIIGETLVNGKSQDA